VVLPDADLDQVTDALIGAGYGSAGERCMAISVGLAVGGVGEALVERLAARVSTLRIGPGTSPGVEMGPLVTRDHLERVRGYVDTGVAEGARLVVDGRSFRSAESPDGFYLGGCLFDAVQPSMRIYKEEILARSSRWCGSAPLPRRSPSSTAIRSATALRYSPETAGRRASSPPGSSAGW
jgi:malonate-semialdehyde dehydrogenase (acetylating) / methylmalonate-semialdehyde dehydrogenase